MRNFAQLVDTSPLPHTSAKDTTDILNIALSVLGAVAFLMIIIAGLRYIIAGGDSNAVAEAKRMVIYSIVGLIVIALAASIVNFVLNKV